MPSDKLHIGKLEETEVEEAADLLSRSFDTTGDYVHMFPDADSRRPALQAFMSAPVRDAQAEGTCWAATEQRKLVGVAAWQGPGRYPWSLGRNLRALPSLLSVLRHAPGRFLDLIRLGSNIDKHFPDDPVWYLQVMGVDPEAQGLGTGSRLLETGLEESDRSGIRAYLETSNSRALNFYQRAGFEIQEAGVPLMPGGPTYWLMSRPPKNA